MPEFISKLQHYISEKGEFSNEKVRSLAQTIELIKTFSWLTERPFYNNNITGPSVTIQDENHNYLKIGLYPNNMFAVYYNDKHFYELHVAEIDDAIKEAKNFFEGQMDLQKFEKHFFNIGNAAYFKTRDFVYRVKLWKALFSSTTFIIFFVLPLIMLLELSKTASTGDVIVITLPLLFFGGLLTYVIIRYIACRNQVIKISRGNDEFFFSDDSSEHKYNKNDVEKIMIYQPGGNKKVHWFYVYEVYFADGTVLKFSNMLISEAELKNKFPDDYFSYGLKSPFWKL